MRKKRVEWYKSEPIGTQEELEEAFEISSSYLYKMIDYSERKEVITKEELDKERRIFTFCNQGPRSGYFRLNPRGRFTSADVLYILTTNHPAEELSRQYGVSGRKIRDIRRGDSPSWKWEYDFVKRLRVNTRNKLRAFNVTRNPIIYTLSHIDIYNVKVILYHIISKRKALELREQILTKKEYNRLIKEGTLDILYPIDQVEVLK